jgi:hypothetical protein
MTAIDNLLRAPVQTDAAAQQAQAPAPKMPSANPLQGYRRGRRAFGVASSLTPPGHEAENASLTSRSSNCDEQIGGNFFFRKYIYTLTFSCDDYRRIQGKTGADASQITRLDEHARQESW